MNTNHEHDHTRSHESGPHMNGPDEIAPDGIDDLLTAAIGQRVARAGEPRPFDQLPPSIGPDPATKPQPIISLLQRNQRGLMVLATAAVALIALGSWALITRDADDATALDVATGDTEIGGSEPGTGDTTTTTEFITTTINDGGGTTAAPSDTTAPHTPTTGVNGNNIVTTEPGPGAEGFIALSVTCGNGEIPFDAQTTNTDDVDDVVNASGVCDENGGLVAIDVLLCGPEGGSTKVEASDGVLPDLATIDACENDTGADTTAAGDPAVDNSSAATTAEPEPIEPDAAENAPESAFGATLVCADGSVLELSFAIDNHEQLDDVVNQLTLCGAEGGLASVRFTPDCGGQATVEANNGLLPDLATIDLCEG